MSSCPMGDDIMMVFWLSNHQKMLILCLFSYIEVITEAYYSRCESGQLMMWLWQRNHGNPEMSQHLREFILSMETIVVEQHFKKQ